MARPRSKHPTDGELEILQFLWSEGPSGLNAIWSDNKERRPVANTTVATMLKVMLDKGLVSRRKGPRGFLWTARKSRAKTAGGMVDGLIDRVFDGSASRLVAHVLDESRVSREELDEIRRLIDKSRKTRKKGDRR